ncbi:DUF72 domain-containing protein [Marinobacter sp. OP 3.4]|uniref:DUF72 domain-containing protein n=1 Tax=Marinobacter sp. OP 3.4 TaxID=3076501 RepID=UPI002E239ED1
MTNQQTQRNHPMPHPYFLGCPQWQHPDWNRLLPPGQSPLARYSQVFNSVEGNTTFYATPSPEQCERWRSQVPDPFRFLFKLPRQITHDQMLAGVDQPLRAFLTLLDPLQDVLGPLLLQLPPAFGPEHLNNLWHFIDTLPSPLTCAVEVRHPAFFDKGHAERDLNRGLRERTLARVCFDTRALFATPATDEATRDAQRKKPRLPLHLLPGDAPPVIRYIGHPDLQANRPFLQPWVDRFADWIAEGKQPYIFMHMPDSGDALALARLWNELLGQRVPAADFPDLSQEAPQIGLF